MAKKKAPAAKSDTPSDSDSNPKGASKGSTLKSGLMPLMLPALAGSALAVLLAGVLLYVLLLQGGSERQMQAIGQQTAQDVLGNLEQQARTLDAVVGGIASDPALVDAISAQDAAALAALDSRIQQQLPHATLARAFAKGTARKDSKTTPAISFAQLDMVSRAEKDNSALPEIHLHDKQHYLTIAKAISNGNRIIGSLLVSFDFARLGAELPALPATAGYVEIVQTFSSQPVAVFSSGDNRFKGSQSYSAKGSIPHFSAQYFPAPDTDLFASSATLLWSVTGAMAVVAALLGLISYILLNKSLQANATALAAHFQALANHDKHTDRFTLGIFASLAQTINRLFEDYDARIHRAKAAGKDGAAAAKPATPLPDFDPTLRSDDVLDVDLHDDDHDLLSTAAEADEDPLLLDDGTDAMDLDMVDMAAPQGLRIDVKVSPDIFRAYDIRGIVGQNLDADVAHAIGAAIGSEAREKGESAVIIARDGRHSSGDLAASLAEGLMQAGVNVIDIGMVPTPVLYYATKTLRTRSGVMVTGSHNPPEYNGFKVVVADETLSGARIQALRNRIESKKLVSGQGNYERHDISQDYLDRINNDVVLAKPMRIVIDGGNGVAGPLAAQILDSLGCTVTPLYTEIDGNFPNHHPDPSDPENLEDLIDHVQRSGADLGIALDGDGDRIGVVTPSGKIIWPDRLLMLLARDLLSRNPGADILYDVKCTRDVAELVSSLGGRAIMCATGHSLMKAKMKETNAVVGGELSGHVFFNDRWYGFDDALYTAARLLEVLSMEPFDADEVFNEFPEKVSTPELHVPVSDSTKFTIIKKLEEQGKFPGGNLVKIDGVRVDFPDCWGLIRASNTTPVLVARFEADTEAALEQVKTVFREQLQSVEPGLSIPF
ncbi:MAG: phosphomannomutase/phosphoglucomutase [Gammaproteobacteria bacterium]